MKMKLSSVVAVALLILAFSSQGQSQSSIATPDECCFSYYSKPIPPKAIKEYKITHPSCTKRAVIFITVKHKKLCVNPEDPSVQDIIATLMF